MSDETDIKQEDKTLDPNAVKQDVQALIAEAVAKETQGLKAKNSELIQRLDKAKGELQRFEGIDPDAVRQMLAKFADDEEAKLIAKGDIQQVLEKRTERMKGDFTKQLEAERAIAERLQKANLKLSDRALADSLSKEALKAGALQEALNDIFLRAKAAGLISNEDGEDVFMRDGQELIGKDGNTRLSKIEWLESLRESAPHLFTRAQGAGANGSGSNGAGRIGVIKPADWGKASAKEKAAYLRAKDPNLGKE